MMLAELLPARDVVFLSAPPWSGPARFSKHHLARYLAQQGHRVLYLEAPLGPLSAARRPRQFAADLRATLRPPRLLAPHLWARRHFNPVPYHAALKAFDGRAANRIGQRLLASAVRADLRRVGFQRPLLIAGLPHAVDLAPLLPHQGLVYHCADDYAHVRGFPASLPALEAELCQRADLVIVTAETLCAPRRQYNPHTYWIPNGAEVKRFARPAEPADDLPSTGQPLIGFVGALAQWVDVGLIRLVALSHPEWQVVLVGPESTDLSAIRGLPNVRSLGPRPYEDVPRYLAAMDVALIPFVDDPVTRGADPIKAYEYLASGVPVVATDIPALRRLQPAIRLADSPESFVQQIEAALAAGRDAGRAERQAEGARHSWASRFAQFEQLVAEHVPA